MMRSEKQEFNKLKAYWVNPAVPKQMNFTKITEKDFFNE